MFKNCCGCQSKKFSLSDDETEKEVPKGLKESEKTPVEEEIEAVSALPNDVQKIESTPRKSSLKKPKPRLSISNEIKIIPNNFDFEEEVKDEVESPLSDEVFQGTTLELPRNNLGVSPEIFAAAAGTGDHFPRTPLTLDFKSAENIENNVLDVPVPPRGQAGTPHPVKRASMPAVLPRWLSEEEDEGGGVAEPPTTPVGKDELALRRYRFFSELLSAAQAAAEHRVRFDPLGPIVNKVEANSISIKDFESVLDRLEKITAQLERTVPLLEQKALIVTKSLEELLDEHFSPTEKDQLLLINEQRKEDTSVSEDFSDQISEEKILVDGESTTSSADTVINKVPDMTNSQSTLAESMSVQGYQDIIQGPLATYIQLSAKIGGDVAEQAKLVQNAFQAQLQYLRIAAESKKPQLQEEQRLLQPTSQQINGVQEYREKHRASAYFNHLSAVSESIPALGWVAVAPTPAPYVKEMNDAGQFYTNRVLKDWKEKDKTHVDWTKAWIQTLTDLQAFVKQHHTTGLVWSGRGGHVAPPSAPLPPPPPPPLDLDAIASMDLSGGAADDRSALFAEINRGADITKGLKKVTSEMQTHKNPSLRSGPAPFKAPVANNQAVKVEQVDKPPKFSRDGKKWIVEYQKGNHQLLVEGAEMNNVVYVYKCLDSTLTVRGKINSIFLDSCKKTAVVFDSVVSSVEFVNCQSVQMQVLNNVPTVSIDKTDGCQIYLSDASLNVNVISSKSSEMNILVPRGNGDFVEYAVPEQFRTTVTKKGLTTIAVESTG